MSATVEDVQVVVRQSGAATVRAEVAATPKGRVVTSVMVSCPDGVTQRAYRDIPISKILEEARDRVAVELPAAGPLPRTSGRTAMTEDLLRQVALVFIEETAPGKDKRAIQRAAARFGRPEGTMRYWVAQARRHGWLNPGSKGRIGADPGPRLLGWKACSQCKGRPPTGFTCQACGSGGDVHGKPAPDSP